MKLAVVIAHVASGWKALSVGEDVVAARKLFKDANSTGELKVGDEFADVVFYFDTSPSVMRKKLKTPETVEQIRAANERVAKIEADRQAQAADAAAKLEGQAKAAEVAAKIVGAVVSEIAATATAPAAPVVPPVAETGTPTASARAGEGAPATDSAPESTAPNGPQGADESADGDEGDHFGSSPRPPKSRRKS